VEEVDSDIDRAREDLEELEEGEVAQ